MTNRADTSSNPNSNHHSLHPRDDREALSALFDGELPGDAIRFALKRLDHDIEWRETCGRWQLIGDALRGEATVVSAPDFAAGVMRALAGERQVAGQAVAPAMGEAMKAAPARRRWIGGAALAASVAVAAVLVLRPYSTGSSPTDSPSTGTRLAAGAATPRPAPTPAGTTSTPTDTPAATTPAVVAASAATAVASLARRPERPVRTSRSTRAPVPPTTTEPDAIAAAAVTLSATGHPFHPRVDDIVTRPWPRSVLSDSAAGGVTVSFGREPTRSSSFYPFEPRLPAEAESSLPPPADPQR
ncbi:RseA family anti-sigma factor [Lysobacter yangpyeongensis]|uniref:RseA family anti-sigma factor n=1 Tax=Lysobacter yangpyeongensis TaxID=346182 RepID=A0ABW0SLP7_9GAMM